MSQAANIIAFPSNKLTFRAMKIDVDKVMARYDYNRTLVVYAVTVLTLAPKKVRQTVLKIDKETEKETVSKLIADFESMSKDFVAMSEMLDAAAARLEAGRRNLI